MGCSNCFNGCVDTVPDTCVKYTGVPIPELGIDTGDPLLVVENQIIKKILEMITGDGIVPEIDPTDLCPLVSGFLPTSGVITLNHVISALLQTVCKLNDDVDALDVRLEAVEIALITLNANYTIGCLTGVTASSGTHNIVQAIITKLCAVELDLATNYVLLSEIDNLVAQYIASVPTIDKHYAKMIPMVAVAYFGDLTGPGPLDGFNASGIGTGIWEKVYLCNGSSHSAVPDLRGVTLVGDTTIVGGTMDAKVNTANTVNPVYDVSDDLIVGNNQAFLTSQLQLPSHTHTIIVAVNDPGHVHTVTGSAQDSGTPGGTLYMMGNIDPDGPNTIGTLPGNTPTPTGLGLPNAITATATPTGQGNGFPNVQPGKATVYIMYIP